MKKLTKSKSLQAVTESVADLAEDGLPLDTKRQPRVAVERSELEELMEGDGGEESGDDVEDRTADVDQLHAVWKQGSRRGESSRRAEQKTIGCNSSRAVTENKDSRSK